MTSIGKTKPSTETVSVGFGEGEAIYIREKADAAKLSTSRWIAALAARHAHPDHDALVLDMVGDFKTRACEGPRSHRVSSVIRSADMDVVRAAARRAGLTAHAWLQAVILVGSERQRVETPLTSRPAAQQHIDHGERALSLVAGTLAAFFREPAKAEQLAEMMRHRAGVMPGEPLSAAAIVAVARAATAPKPADRSNVVELRPVPAVMPPSEPVPDYRREGRWIVDRDGNRAALSTFDSEQACRDALASCSGCTGCVDCVDCHGCHGCESCGQCRDCHGCKRCIAQVGKRDATDVVIAH